MLVAIRRRGEDAWVMGIVRRMRRLSAQDAEIGLQLIANTLASAELSSSARRATPTIRSTAQHRRSPAAQFHGLFLSFNRRPDEPPVQSLIVPAVEYPRIQALYAADRHVRAHDPARAPARAACGLGLDGHRPGGARIRRRRRRHGRLTRARWRSTATARSSRRTAGTSRRNSTSRTPAARAGRTIARASRCTGRTSPARRLAYTFWDLQQQANRLSNALAALGVGRGDKVALILPQRPETVVAHIATYQLGAVAVPLSFLFGPEALEYRLNDSEARIAFVDPQSLPNLAPIRDRCPGIAHVDRRRRRARGVDHAVRIAARARRRRASRRSTTRADDPALLIYTSGTTGPPKGALMPQRCLLGNLPGFVHSHDGYPREGDLFWSPADWAWTGGLMDALLPALYFGQPIVGYRGRFDPERALALMAKYGVRNSFLFPTALKMMMKAVPRPRERFDVDLRTIMSAGEAVGTTVFEWAREALGVTINEMFGQTEMNYIVGNSQELWPAKPGSMGRPYPGHRIAVIDDDGQRGRRRRDRRGRGAPHRARRRRRIPSSSSNTSRIPKAPRRSSPATGAAPAISRGATTTATSGTRAAPTTCSRRQATGSARRRSRTASSGTRRWPTRPSCPSPDETRGNVVKAFIVLAAGEVPSAAIEDDIRQHVRRHLAPYEYPKEIEFIDALPMTTTGKVQRRVLRERERAEEGGGHGSGLTRAPASRARRGFARRRPRLSRSRNARCVSTHATAGTTVGRISAPNWYANAIASRCQATNPVCDATCGPIVIATFFRKSASTPHATNGISAA